MARKLTKTAREMVEAAGVAPEDLQIYLSEEIEAAAEIAQLKINDFLQLDLQQAGSMQSLQGYEAGLRQSGTTKFSIGGESIDLPDYELTVVPTDAHIDLDLNVFNILDTGRKALERKGNKVYVFWSWQPGSLSIGTKSAKIRDVKGRFGSQFRATRRFESVTPIRPEPRQTRGPIVEARGPFFARSAKAVPGRNLYQRMLKKIKTELKSRGYITDTVSFNG